MMNTEIRTLNSASQTNDYEYISNSLQTRRKATNTLLDCPARFNGEYGTEKIDRFLNYIEAYKKVKNIDDEQSLLELPHLLLDYAYTWWRRLPDSLSTWPKAIQALRLQFSHIKPAHNIYSEIFGNSYNMIESIEKFINDKLELFAQLPRPAPTESVQLDMIYGLLPYEFRDKIMRTDIKHFADLIEKIKALKENDSKGVDNSKDILKDINDNRMTSLDKMNERVNKRVHVESINEDLNTVACAEPEEREPIIKVRRTEDLMPQIKAEDTQEQEFIAEEPTEYQQQQSTDDENSTHLTISNIQADFQIDSDLMSQINNIIENCDMEATAVNSSAAVLVSNKSSLLEAESSTTLQPLMSLQISDTQTHFRHTATNPPTKTSRPNRLKSITIEPVRNELRHATSNPPAEVGKTNRLADVVIETVNHDKSNDSKQLPANSVADGVNTAPKRKRIRCNFCRGGGHSMQKCLKRIRKLQEMQNKSLTTESPATSVIIPTSHATSSVSITLVAESQTVSTSKFLTPASSAAESHTALTTKLISSADVPSPGKLLAAKLKNPTSNIPSVKCHQCGMVGYYRSICPNCSPIYFYKPHNSVNR